MSIPSPVQIRVRAYQIYLERGREPGHAMDDWLQAEYELLQLPIRKLGELPSDESLLVNVVQAALFLGEGI